MTPHDDLATLRGTVADCQDVLSAPEVDRAMTALDRLEAERAAPCRCDRCHDCIAANGYEEAVERAEAAEAALADVRRALEQIAAMTHAANAPNIARRALAATDGGLGRDEHGGTFHGEAPA